METETWTKWTPPYDPRMCDGSIVTRDERGRYIESPDCGRRCAGCGLCCLGYRDDPNDFEQTEEFMANLKLGPMVKLEGGSYYRPGPCGPDCPGYGQCCQPMELRPSQITLAEARHILLEREDACRWEIESATMFLAHEGTPEAVAILRAFRPRAHVKVAYWAELALEEGEFFASTPRTPEEERLMCKREVLHQWEDRLYDIMADIEEELEPEVECRSYEYEIAQGILEAAQDEEKRQTWEIQTSVLHDLLVMAQANLKEAQEQCAIYETMIAAMEADLGDDARDPLLEDEIPF